MELLKQSTAVTLKYGPFLDETDGMTAETALTITQADVRLSKNGANMIQKSETTSFTHDEIGFYDCLLDTTDTGTLGVLKVMVHESGALPVWREYMVVPSNVYDSLVLGTDDLDVQVSAIDANAITASAFATDAIDNTVIAANAIGASELATDAVDEIVDGVWDEIMTGHVVLGSYGQAFAGYVTGAVNDAGATNSQFDTDGFTEASTAHFAGSLLTFTTGALLGQSRIITTYSAGGQNCAFDRLWTEAPANNDEFVITSPVGPINRLTLAAANGRPNVNITEVNGVASPSLVGGRFDASVGAMATNVLTASAMADNAIDSGAFAINAIDSSALSPSAVSDIRSIIDSTATATGTTTTLIDTATLTEANDDHWKGQLIHIKSGTTANIGQVRLITGFTASSDTLTFAPPLNGATASSDGYEIRPMGGVVVRQWLGVTPNALVSGAVDADVSAIQNDVITAAAVANAAFDAATFAAGAVDANAIAADAADKIADALLKRDIDQVEATAPIHSLTTAILKAVSRIVDDAGTMKTYRTDGTTLKMSQTITTNPSGDPIDELVVGV